MSLRIAVCSAAFIASSLSIPSPAVAGPDEYIGQIILGGWNFCPRFTLPANGQLLPIAQNQSLFSLYGTIYGGNGRTTFALPDLRGRAPIHNGNKSNRLGSRGNGSSDTKSPEGGTLALQYCVVVSGTFPSRN